MTVGGTPAGTTDSSPSSPNGGSFAYGSRSLDELRSLAGSVDTARITDTQGDFTRVAHQMDDVVTQLLAMQSRIPSWWHGASADEALAKFSQVINHAQTVYTMADGASRALSTCVNVVTEQQAAMGNVPEVPEPRSGLEAGAVFRGAPTITQQAAALVEEQRYEAARGRAVEVVNGIAAQFVETTAQFQTLDSNLSDSAFRAIATPQLGSETNLTRTRLQSRPQSPEVRQYSKHHFGLSEVEPISPYNPHNDLMTHSKSRPLHHTTESDTSSTARESADVSTAYIKSGEASDLRTREGSTAQQAENGKSNSKAFGLTSEWPYVDDSAASAQPAYHPHYHGDSLRGETTRSAARSDHSSINTPDTHPGRGDQRRPQPPTQAPANDVSRASSRGDNTWPDREYPSETQAGIVSAAVPPREPFAHSRALHRGARPDYLKAPKSVWLTGEPSAPSDGIMTPGWDCAT